jgi:hypothetical protein
MKSELVSEARVAEATAVQAVTGRSEDYGYGWWVSGPEESIDWFRADGDGGQRILVVPALDLVVVATGGGYEWDPVVDGVAASATDGWDPLPADPAAEAALAAAVAALAASPEPVDPGPLPDMAASVSGVTWGFPANPYVRSVRLDFGAPDAATATIDVVSERDVRVDRVGLDGVVRASLAGRPILATGRWTDEHTFEIDIDEGPGLHRYPLALRFDGDGVELEVLGESISGVPVAAD